MFHAAAQKQVPSCDFFTMEAVKTNVIGIIHGKIKYEPLFTKEEAAKAIDMGNYYAVPADNRYVNSDNTLRLILEETKAKSHWSISRMS